MNKTLKQIITDIEKYKIEHYFQLHPVEKNMIVWKHKAIALIDENTRLEQENKKLQQKCEEYEQRLKFIGVSNN